MRAGTRWIAALMLAAGCALIDAMTGKGTDSDAGDDAATGDEADARQPTCLLDTLCFGQPLVFDVGALAASVAIGDVDDDGDLDVAVVSVATARVTVLFNQGDMTFTMTNYSTPPEPSHAVMADFDDDGRDDIATIQAESGGVTIALSEPGGTFDVRPEITVAGRPVGLAVADFNEDGLPDIVLADADGSSAFLLFALDTGGFSLSSTGVGMSAVSIATGDFDNDGNDDFVVSVQNPNGLIVKFGDGAGAFPGQVFIETSCVSGDPISVGFIAVAAFDDSGTDDIAALWSGMPCDPQYAVMVALGQAGQTFAPLFPAVDGAASLIAAGRLDTDPTPDLAVADLMPGLVLEPTQVVLFKSDGDGSFMGNLGLDPGAQTEWVKIGDLNGDGLGDIVLSSQTQGIAIIVPSVP